MAMLLRSLTVFLAWNAMFVTVADTRIYRTGWLDRVVEYFKQRFIADVQEKLPPIGFKAEIVKAPKGYVDSTKWDYDSVVRLLNMIRQNEKTRPLLKVLRRKMNPKIKTRRNFMSKQQSYVKFPKVSPDVDVYYDDSYYDEYGVVDGDYNDNGFGDGSLEEDSLITISNPVESRLPGTQISVSQLREILDSRARAARVMPHTTKKSTTPSMSDPSTTEMAAETTAVAMGTTNVATELSPGAMTTGAEIKPGAGKTTAVSETTNVGTEMTTVATDMTMVAIDTTTVATGNNTEDSDPVKQAEKADAAKGIAEKAMADAETGASTATEYSTKASAAKKAAEEEAKKATDAAGNDDVKKQAAKAATEELKKAEEAATTAAAEAEKAGKAKDEVVAAAKQATEQAKLANEAKDKAADKAKEVASAASEDDKKKAADELAKLIEEVKTAKKLAEEAAATAQKKAEEVKAAVDKAKAAMDIAEKAAAEAKAYAEKAAG